MDISRLRKKMHTPAPSDETIHNLPRCGRALENSEANEREESDDRLHFGIKAERAVESCSR